ncbi:hypothetical protein GGH95_006655, partial [Coemansia sp. RSA 1836]
SGDDDGDVGSGSEGELEDIDDVPSPRIRRRPAAVISDDDDDEDEPVAPAARPLLEPERKARQPARDGSAGVGSSNKDKAKFLGMFKMPAAKNTAAAATAKHQARPAALSPPHLASIETASPAPHQSSFPEIPVSASQDLSYLFPSQYGMVSDTQDSLLLTPAEDMRDGGGRQYDSVMDTQMSSVGHLESFPEYLVTQPTQMMDDDDDDEEVGRVQVTAQVTQPTQLMVATGSDADDSVLPLMVRQALASAVSSDLEEPVEDASSASSNGDDGEDRGISSMVDASLMSPPRAPAGRLLRRGDVVAQRKQKRRNAKRSEFVEAEAEVGDSSDSDGEAK